MTCALSIVLFLYLESEKAVCILFVGTASTHNSVGMLKDGRNRISDIVRQDNGEDDSLSCIESQICKITYKTLIKSTCLY